LASSNRARVLRYEITNTSDLLPRTIIVKQAVHPDMAASYGAVDGSLWQDWASLAFLTTLTTTPAIAPLWYGSDPPTGVCALQDIIEGRDLRDVLLHGDALQARLGLRAYFRALGYLHAGTRGCEDHFAALRAALGPYVPQRSYYRAQWRRTIRRYTTMLSCLAVPSSRATLADLRAVLACLARPAEFLTFIHGDIAPFNCLVANDKAWLIDFEYATFAHALLDVAQARMLFPSCGFVNELPQALLLELEHDYRAAAQVGLPAVADDEQFYTALAAACAYWAINFCTWRSFPEVLAQDHAWGLTTLRQLYVLRAELFARTTEEVGRFQALGATFSMMARMMRAVWPEVSVPLPLYPAFRPSRQRNAAGTL
jgi:aminoglycoside phosphotransferase (APT) family kinase protein